MNTQSPQNNGMPSSNGWVPPAQNQPNNGQHGGYKFFQALRNSGFFRAESRWVGGVAGGLARKLNVDPTVVRLIFVILGFVTTGVALVLYAAAWALLPEERDGRIHAEELIRGNFDAAVIAIALTAIVGFTSGDSIFWFGSLPGPMVAIIWLGFLAAIGYAVHVIYSQYEENKANTPHNQKPGNENTFPVTPPTAQRPQEGFPVSNDLRDQPTVSPEATQPSVPGARGFAQTDPQGTAPMNGFGAQGPQAGSPQPQPSYWGPQQPVPMQWQAPEPDPYKPSGGFALAFGLFLIAVATMLALNFMGMFTGWSNAAPLLIAAAIIIGGLVVIFNGVRGRSSGSAGFFSITALLAGLFIAVPLTSGLSLSTENFHAISDQRIAPSSVEDLQHAVSFGVGDLEIDLSNIPLTELRAVTDQIDIAISGGVGDITVYVPESLPIDATTHIGLGDYSDPKQDQMSLTGGEASLSTAGDSFLLESAPFNFDITLGIGNVEIVEVDDLFKELEPNLTIPELLNN